MNEPGLIGSMQYAGMQRIMIGDGFTADQAARAVAAFAAAGLDVWVWVTGWVGAREFQAGSAERAAGRNPYAGDRPWRIPPPPVAIAEAERGYTTRWLRQLEEWANDLSSDQKAKLAAILGLPEAAPVELVRWAGELLRIALDADSEHPG